MSAAKIGPQRSKTAVAGSGQRQLLRSTRRALPIEMVGRIRTEST
jgi:hypothetical protein